MRGKVYIYELISGRWVETQIIAESTLPGLGHALGDSLAMADGRLVIGDSGGYYTPTDIPGFVFVYKRENNMWIREVQLSGSQAGFQERFGYSVAVSGDIIFVGIPGQFLPSQSDGRTVLFKQNQDAWIEQATLSAPPEPDHHFFGSSVSCSGNLVAAGAVEFLVELVGGGGVPIPPNALPGTVYITSLASDCNGDGILDECEVLAGAPDINGNMRPDACEPDCNANLQPDEFDLPGNDCNLNFTPDECDIDSTDPDGDGLMSLDCDGDETPDECQIERITLKQTLSYSPPATATRFDADGDWLIVTDSIRTVNGVASGAADVYRMIDREWVFQQEITPPDPTEDARFGTSVSVSGDRAIIGAPNVNKAYAFEYDGIEWVFRDNLTRPSGTNWTGFGGSVALSGDDAVVGIQTFNSTGAAAFHWNGINWSNLGALGPTGATVSVQYGSAVAIDGDWIAVGDFSYSANGVATGAAFMFRKGDNEWHYVSRIVASDGFISDGFGNQLKLSGKRLAVSAPRARQPGQANFSGAVYLFSEYDGQWSEQTKIAEYDPPLWVRFGEYLDIESDSLLIGAPYWRGPQEFPTPIGAAFLYQLSRDSDAELIHIFDQPVAMGNLYGNTLALHRRGVIINHPTSSTERGVRYLEFLRDCNQNLVLDICEADCNANGLADDCETAGHDVALFTHHLLHLDSAAFNCLFDVNADGQMNGIDIQPFIERFLAASP
jgi:hypothetical protein